VRGTTGAVLSPAAIPHPREEHFSVLVVDDHPLLREAIAARLRSMGAGVVHEAASVAEARARARRVPHVLCSRWCCPTRFRIIARSGPGARKG